MELNLTTFNTSEDGVLLREWLSERYHANTWGFSLVLTVIMLVGGLGNPLVMAATAGHARRNTAQNCVYFMAVIDFLISVVAIPYDLYQVRHYYSFTSEAACKILEWLKLWLLGISNAILVVIAMERFYTISQQGRSSCVNVLARRSRGLLVFLALLSAVASAPALYYIGIEPGRLEPHMVQQFRGLDRLKESGGLQADSTILRCKYLTVHYHSIGVYIFSLVLFLWFLVVVVLCLVFYAKIYWYVREVQLRLRSHDQGIKRAHGAAGTRKMAALPVAVQVADDRHGNDKEAASTSVDHANTASTVSSTKGSSSDHDFNDVFGSSSSSRTAEASEGRRGSAKKYKDTKAKGVPHPEEARLEGEKQGLQKVLSSWKKNAVVPVPFSPVQIHPPATRHAEGELAATELDTNAGVSELCRNRATNTDGNGAIKSPTECSNASTAFALQRGPIESKPDVPLDSDGKALNESAKTNTYNEESDVSSVYVSTESLKLAPEALHFGPTLSPQGAWVSPRFLEQEWTVDRGKGDELCESNRVNKEEKMTLSMPECQTTNPGGETAFVSGEVTAAGSRQPILVQPWKTAHASETDVQNLAVQSLTRAESVVSVRSSGIGSSLQEKSADGSSLQEKKNHPSRGKSAKHIARPPKLSSDRRSKEREGRGRGARGRQGEGEERGRRGGTTTGGLTREQRRKLRAARVLLVVTGASILCWMPLWALDVCYLVWPDLEFGQSWAMVSVIGLVWHSYFLSPAANPVLYAVCSPEFRRKTQQLLLPLVRAPLDRCR